MNRNQALPSTLWAFIWHYLKHKKMCLAGFVLVGLIWAIEMSLSPYLLKVIIDRVVQNSSDHVRMMHVVLFPCVLYASMTLVLNLNFRFYEYIKLKLFPALKAVVKKDMFTYVLSLVLLFIVIAASIKIIFF
jgi:ATP-binding cassette subfamily B protein